jgi:hypothetical protein
MEAMTVTEAEWLNGVDPIAMLGHLSENKSVRKRQLFCVACWKPARRLFEEEGIEDNLALLERFAENDWADEHSWQIDEVSYAAIEDAFREVEDALTNRFWDRGEGGEEELWNALHEGTEAALTSWDANSFHAGAVLTTMTVALSTEAETPLTLFGLGETPAAADVAARAAANAAARGTKALSQWRKRQQLHADLVREVFGNPFRSLRVARKCLAWNGGVVRQLAQGIYEKRAFYRMPILADALEEAGCKEANILDHCRSSVKHVRGCWIVDLLLEKG